MQKDITDYKKYLNKKRECVLCNSSDFDLWAKADVFDVVECKKCGLVFVNPCLTAEGLDIVYKGHHEGRMDQAELCKQREKMYEIDRDFLLETIDHGKILDIGCGGGFFLSKFDPKKWQKSGVEIDPDTVAYARDNFGIKDVRLWDSNTIPYDDNTFDVVMFRGSIEHMVNPDVALKEAHRVLKPKGYLYLCATPNVDSFCAKIYREKWNQFDAKEHIFMFSAETLKKMAKPLGFKTVKTAVFYEETPYCDLENDIPKVMADYQLHQEGKRAQMGISPAFWGNMLNIIFRKSAG